MDGPNRDILEWYFEIPPITRAYLTGIVIVSVLAQFEYVSVLQLYFNYRLVFLRQQWWRLVTPFLYFGPINFDFVFHMFFLMRYCRALEDEWYRRRPADFFMLVVFGATLMLLIGPLLRAPFLSTSLTFMIVYVWSRRNPSVLMNFLGILNFNAPYMPWVLLGFSFLLSGQLPVSDVIGIVVGHAYYYLCDIFPRLYGWHPLQTPDFLSRLLNPRDEMLELRGEDSDREPQEGEAEAAGVSPRPPRLEITDAEEDTVLGTQDFSHED